MENDRKRPHFLTTMAILFAVLALSDLTKAWQVTQNDVGGIVVFGVRFREVLPNIIFGGLLAIVLLAYARGLWTMQRWVLNLAIVYAFWVPVNLVLFWHREIGQPKMGIVGLLAYLFVALGGSIGTAIYLCCHQHLLSPPAER